MTVIHSIARNLYGRFKFNQEASEYTCNLKWLIESKQVKVFVERGDLACWTHYAIYSDNFGYITFQFDPTCTLSGEIKDLRFSEGIGEKLAIYTSAKLRRWLYDTYFQQ
ncbi:hypothetical protein VCHA53O466_40250 [Vibrio chagasii]|nr:hypothetical protein VCHA53O466_40250 [Vibrio chagasii]